MKASCLLAAVFVLSATAARAGTFSTAAWTNDATSGIANGQTSWASHFGSAASATVNGVTVTGFAGPNASDGNFDLTGMSNVFNGDTNNITALGGAGSAVMAQDFVYGGNPATITVKSLTVGTTYTVSFLSVGWDAVGVRMITFASGGDSRLVDQGQFGDNNGIRIDYTFTATAETKVITLTPQNAGFRFHLYGLALRPESAPTTVTNNADAGPGSLRWALTNAKDRAGADTVTFSPALSGQTITLGSEIVIDDAAGVTIDASSLPGGIIVSGGNAKRVLSLSSGSVVTLRGLTLTGGNAVGATDSGRGGAIYSNSSTLGLDRCTLNGNSAFSGSGGAIFANFGTLGLANCTLMGNTAGFRGGAIFSKAPLSLTHCTVTLNGTTSTDAVSSGGGGIYGEFVALTVNNSIIAGNTVGPGVPDAKDILCDLGSVTRQGANIVQDYVSFGGTTTSGPIFTIVAPNLAALASNGGPTKTMLPNTGSPAINAAIDSAVAIDQRGLSRPQGGTADIGAVEVATASTFVVQNNADSGTGTLREAIANAAVLPGADTITFAPGLSGQTITLTTGQLTLGTDVTIDASALATPVTISGNSNGDNVPDPGESRIFYILEGVTVVMRRLNLIAGSDGAIFNEGQLTVDQSTLSGHSSSAHGGAIFNYSGATLTLTQSTLSGNSADGHGGGIYNGSGATLTLTQSTLSGNSASGHGGGIYNLGTVTLIQSTLSGNSASHDGGGIYNLGGTLDIDQSTISGNSASNDGGGICNLLFGTLELFHTIVAGNTAPTHASITGAFTGGGNLTSGDPLLAPLGNYGGPTKTMPPLPGSPAIDAGVITSDTTDQRGAPRVADGDGNGSAIVDIGAVEFAPAVVTTTADSGTGSLRALLAAPFTSTVTFGPALTGGTIALTTGQITLSRSMIIDASGLPRSITISGNGASRIFEVTTGATVGLKRLTLTGGNGVGSTESGQGGAIYSLGDLSLDRCTFYGNSADEGGAVRSKASGFDASHCSFTGNTAVIGGACSIANAGKAAVLTHCSLVGNTATGTNSTLGNIGGGGLFLYQKNITITNTIIAGNSSPFSPDARNFDIDPASGGGNLIGDNTGLTWVANVTDIIGTSASPINPLLAPLGNYGGPTKTMPPLPGSPAIDAGGSTTDTTDQRGAPRVADGDGNGSAIVDIGAVEFAPALVTNAFDSGTGALRDALADPFTTVISFAPNLDGAEILIFSGPLSPTRDVTIDASALSRGLSLSALGISRLFEVPAGTTLTLKGMTLTRGNGGDGSGGAITCAGTLVAETCNFTDNFANTSSGLGGAIYGSSGSTLILARCTFRSNTAFEGGAVRSSAGAITATHCTFWGNSASIAGACSIADGGAAAVLRQCTVTGNTATGLVFPGPFNVGGGGLFFFGKDVTIANCIIAGNTCPTGFGVDMQAFGGVFTLSGNLVGNNDTVSSIFPTGPLVGSSAVPRDALLAPLGNYGGPTKTMPPLPGSPAIDAGGGTTETTDQRGAPRVVDGDGNGSAIVDIGAVETGAAVIVTNVADSGPGTLRAALSDPFAAAINFASPLDGATITLTSGQFSMSHIVTIDASSLSKGITISGNSNGDATMDLGESRIFDIPSGVAVTLRRLNLINGVANPADTSVNGRGGAIRNAGQLTMDECTISGCRADRGGAVVNASGGLATITRTTFSGNFANTSSGGFYCSGVQAFSQCTFSGNSSGGFGGAMNARPGSQTSLTQCTFADNHANGTRLDLDGGGAIDILGGTLNMTGCILAGNTAATGNGPDLWKEPDGTLSAATNCLIGDGDDSTIINGVSGNQVGTTATPLNPLLGPLANYGGPTQTKPPLPGSPAIDAGGGTTEATDQRGAPRVVDGDGNGSAIADIGAVEAGAVVVVTDTADSGPGSLRAALVDPFTYAISFASQLSGATIILTTGQLSLSHSVTIDASALSNGITISGGSDGDNIIESGESRIFDVLAGTTVTLRRLNLINGIADPTNTTGEGNGGAIRNAGNLTVDGCTISACRAESGGGISSWNGALMVTGSTVVGNVAGNSGGGISVLDLISAGGPTLDRSTVSNNSANNVGGAIFCFGALNVTDSTFAGNSGALGGGGIYVVGNFTFTRSTFTGNSTMQDGGVLYAIAGLGTIVHSTIAGNSAAHSGGGVYLVSAPLEMNHSIVAGNTATVSDPNIAGAFTGSNNFTSGDPLLAPLGNHSGLTQTMPPLPGSPARDAATGSTATSDQRGLPIVGTPDIGAAEAQIGAIANTTTNEDTATASIPFSVGTVETLSASSSVPALVSGFSFSGSGANRTLTVTPAANANGVATITVSDSLTGDTQAFQLNVTAVNDAPSFTKGANQSVQNNAGAVSVSNWATAISAGPPDESGQTLTFNVSNSNNAIFTGQPAISSAGLLTFTPAAGAVGSATVTVTLSDNGGTANGGVSTSTAQTFSIQVTQPPITVTSLADSGAGSLRDQLAAAPAGSTITFAPGFTGPIVLGSEIVFTKNVIIDASALPNGVTIDGGPGTNRIFSVNSAQNVTLICLTLTGGNGAGASVTGAGGAIFNIGILSLTRCTLSGNTSTISGGAIRNAGNLTLTRCTFHGNSAGNNGGAIYNTNVATLVHCTVSANTATAGFLGGGIHNNSGTLNLTHTIVAQNIAGSQASGPDIYKSAGTFTPAGVNFIGDLTGTGLGASGTLLTGDAFLASPGNYGGPTKTMALRPASPARNAATGSTTTSDQRGFPIVGTPDIGAYEAGTLSDFDAFAVETTGAALTATGDADQDGRSDLLEYAAQTDPRVSSTGEITAATYDRNAAGAITQANVSFQTRVGATDVIYTLQCSATLTGSWSNIVTWNAATSIFTSASGINASRNASTGVVSASDANVSGQATAFYRLQVQQVP